MRNDYAEDRSDADELIDEFGQDGLLRRRVTTEGDPVDHPAVFVVLDYEDREVDGARILATDKRVLIAAGGLAVEPKPSDRLIIGGTSHAIIQVKPFSPAGIVVFWEAQTRK
jgi:hypothetical protein